MSKPILPGKIVKVGTRRWKIAAVGDVGERYYWMVNPKDDRDVAMFPASLVENEENRRLA